MSAVADLHPETAVRGRDAQAPLDAAPHRADGRRSRPASARDAVLAVVVCHEPNRERLSALLRALGPAARLTILLIDNSESEYGCVAVRTVALAHGVEAVCNGRNLGVAEAHNIGLRRAQQTGSEYALLLDQDSVLDADAVNSMLAAFSLLRIRGRKVAALGPSVLDPRTSNLMHFVRLGRLRMKRLPRQREPVNCDLLISSGCLLSMDAVQRAGLMDESFFIDYVDMEWCSRARRAGYEIVGLSDVTMSHTVGEQSVRLAGREIAVHTPVRSYYLVRNALLFARKPLVPWSWRVHLLYRAVGHLLIFSVMFPQRLQRVRWMARGALDGLSGRGGRLGGPDGLGINGRSLASGLQSAQTRG